MRAPNPSLCDFSTLYSSLPFFSVKSHRRQVVVFFFSFSLSLSVCLYFCSLVIIVLVCLKIATFSCRHHTAGGGARDTGKEQMTHIRIQFAWQ